MKIIPTILDFIAPRFCISCNCKLNLNEQFICGDCFSEIEQLSADEIEHEYERKFSNTDFVDGYIALFNFKESGKLQDLIHALKYKQKFNIGIFLGKFLAEKKINVIKRWNADLIIPIPLHHLKKIERGYNQSDYIAKGVGKILGIPVLTSTAKRIKNTPSQTKLNIEERTQNIEGAFVIKKPSNIEGKNIIIVDDVITTGATMLELAKKIKEQNAKNIFCLSVATPLISHSFGSGNTKN